MNESLPYFFLITMGAFLSSLLLIYLAFSRLRRIFRNELAPLQRLHDSLTLFAYALFPPVVILNIGALSGMVGDGFTSPYRQVSRETLLFVPIVQVAIFLAMIFLQIKYGSILNKRTSKVFLFPILIPVLEITLWI